MASSKSDFESLQLVSENIYLYEPQESVEGQLAGDGSSAPSIIIICTWNGGATPRRINKYIAQYRQIYPGTIILVITTTVPNTAFWPLRVVRSRLQPTCEVIQRILAKSTNPKVLLHLFSHGGGSMAAQLALSMQEGADKGALFLSSLRGVIFDCCPGHDSFQQTYGAAKLSMGTDVLSQIFTKTMLYPSIAVISKLQSSGVLRSVQDIRGVLHDPSTFGAQVRRLYIYTKEDTMVGWADVQKHIEEARSRGYPVDQVLFEHGTHCSLIMEDSTRYWSAVQRFWNGEHAADPGLSNVDEVKVRSRL
ncbi:uncharacterized protein N7511_008806 [Penicillium nucicola]|uniref:uncharacterized protein n=1 Tax=Penicillium nucicola TaxID=1850975 RepID=UPI002544DC08|nr:uncharacterized protein N7511_008806 [Penicillium nucicola]KAJ5747110.1 hypothetical protein N7511_008806 [Penicillium nucicola]